MTDTFTKEDRSRIMASVKSKDSKAEIAVRSTLHRLGYRFRLHKKELPGKPDIVLPKYRTIIFIHGCFWHRHTCKHATTPKSNIPYWTKKFTRNIERFNQVKAELEAQGWRILVIWECETNDKFLLEQQLQNILSE